MPKQSDSYDLMLCGGGVIGLSIAYYSALQGWKVLVVDAGAMGHAASWAGAGILPAGATLTPLDPLEQLRALSHQLHQEWSQSLFELTGIDNEYRRCGGIYLARTPAERATLAANCMWWDDHGILYELWSNNELAKRVPAMRPLIAHTPELQCWWVQEDCRLRNPLHVDALLAACRKLNVTLIENTPVERFEVANDRIQTAHAKTASFRADRFCVTSGAWASQLLGPLGIESGILPVRGQMVLYKLEQPLFPMVINEGHRYLVPRDDGHLLAGSCEEEVGFDTNTTQEMIDQLQAWASEVVPELRCAQVKRTWAGLRPGSFDSYPYLGTLHPIENGFIAAGHFRHGLHWSTATAHLMFRWMAGQKTDIDLRPFRVGRGQSMGNTD
jgi:glycine oxidase